jgi:hypothetical protein
MTERGHPFAAQVCFGTQGEGESVISKACVALVATMVVCGTVASAHGGVRATAITAPEARDLLYVGDGQQGIYVFDAARPGRQPIEVIADSNGPAALAVDNNQWL